MKCENLSSWAKWAIANETEGSQNIENLYFPTYSIKYELEKD